MPRIKFLKIQPRDQPINRRENLLQPLQNLRLYLRKNLLQSRWKHLRRRLRRVPPENLPDAAAPDRPGVPKINRKDNEAASAMASKATDVTASKAVGNPPSLPASRTAGRTAGRAHRRTDKRAVAATASKTPVRMSAPTGKTTGKTTGKADDRRAAAPSVPPARRRSRP